LQRTDLRQFEIERNLRHGNSSVQHPTTSKRWFPSMQSNWLLSYGLDVVKEKELVKRRHIELQAVFPRSRLMLALSYSVDDSGDVLSFRVLAAKQAISMSLCWWTYTGCLKKLPLCCFAKMALFQPNFTHVPSNPFP